MTVELNRLVVVVLIFVEVLYPKSKDLMNSFAFSAVVGWPKRTSLHYMKFATDMHPYMYIEFHYVAYRNPVSHDES